MKLALSCIAVLASSPLADAQCEHLKLTDFDAPPYQGGNNRPDYGEVMDMSGDRLAVGIPGSGADGKVEVYELDGPNWRLMAVVDPPPFVSDDFASDVAISGDTLLVADRFDQKVYVHDWDGAAWTFTQMLPSSFATTQFTNYARAVAIDGDRALVSDPRLAGLDGLVFVFERDGGGVWSETARLGNPDDAGPLPDFGFDLALDGDLAVVGAPRSNAVVSGGGAVYAYRNIGVGWEPPTRLDPASTATMSSYGQAVDVSGNTVFVGDGGSSLVATFAGAVHIWEDQGSSWTEVTAFGASDAATVGLGFGKALDVEGNLAIVGCPARDAGGGASGAGGGYVLQNPGSGWVETDILVPADRGLSDEIGSAVATNGEMVVLGSPGDDDEGPDFGAAYTFSVSGTICPTLQSFPKRLSVASGGVFTMLLRPGLAFANQDYIVVGSFTGTAPGFFLDGLFFPLNQDDWFNLVLENANRFLFANTVGTLDAAGRATATFTLPGGLPPGLAGIRFHWAYAVFDAQDGSTLLVSTPVQLRLDV